MFTDWSFNSAVSQATARTNDAIPYGGTAYHVVECDDEEELKKMVNKTPSNGLKITGSIS